MKLFRCLSALSLLALLSSLASEAQTLSASALTFPATAVGSVAPAQQVTLTNPASSLNRVTFGPQDGSQDFQISSNCVSPLLPGQSCTATVLFVPSAVGPRTSSVDLAITGIINGFAESLTVSFTGSGSNGPLPLPLVLSPASLSFAPLTPGSTSLPRSITVTNPNSTMVTLNGGGFGGTAASDYAISSNNCGQTLAASSSCLVQITFTPSTSGQRPAQLQVATTAATQPQIVQLNNLSETPGTINAVGSFPSAVDSFGNYYTFTSANNQSTVQRVSPDGVSTTIAGGGTGSGDGVPAVSVSLSAVLLITVDSRGNLYLLQGDETLRKVSTDGIITTVLRYPIDYSNLTCGNGAGQFPQSPNYNGLVADGQGNVYLGEANEHLICKITPTGAVSTVYAPKDNYFGDPVHLYGRLLSADDIGNVYFTGTERLNELFTFNKVTVNEGLQPIFIDSGVDPNYNVDLNGSINISAVTTVDRLTTDGVTTRVAFTGADSYSGTGGPPLSATTDGVYGVLPAPNGDFYTREGAPRKVSY